MQASFKYLWLTISTVPYCSIHSFPSMTLCTQQLGLLHVYASLCLDENCRGRKKEEKGEIRMKEEVLRGKGEKKVNTMRNQF